MEDREVRADAKLKNLQPEDLDLLWEFRNPGPGGKKLTFSKIRVEIPLRWGFSVSQSTLSDFYAWLRLKRQWDRSIENAKQARIELAKSGEYSEEELNKFEERVLKTEAVETGNAKNYVAIRKLRVMERDADREDRKMTILEAKAARMDALEAKAKEIKAGGGLSAETLEVIEKQLKLL